MIAFLVRQNREECDEIDHKTKETFTTGRDKIIDEEKLK
jgi:hypothetical protein